MDRLKAGVEVRILNDFLGCIQYKKDELKALRDAGAQWSRTWRSSASSTTETTARSPSIDGVIGHSGGFNIGQEYIDGKPKYPHWRDTGVRIVGPAVRGCRSSSRTAGTRSKRESLFTEKYFPALARATPARS